MQFPSCLDAALHYLSKGFSVIPVGGDKKPLLDWKRFQTERADEATVRGWYAQWPQAGVGIVTGAISGIVVVDIDPGRGGRESMGKLIQEGAVSREDLQTPTVRTQSGGIHLYYARPQLVGNSVDLLPGIDIRGDGGYVVAPPTQRDAEHRWSWMDGRNLELAMKPLPAFFLKAPPGSNGTSRVLTREEFAKLESGVSGGQRHDVMKKLVGHWCALRWGREAVWVAVAAWNAKNTPPLTDDELSAQFGDMWQRWGNPSQALELGAILEAAKSIQDKKALKLELLKKLQEFGETHRLSGKDRAYWGEMFKIVAGFPTTTFKALIPMETPNEDGVVDAPSPEEAEDPLSPEEREAGLRLLSDPRVFWRLARTIRSSGYVGDPRPALVVYLALTSRLLDDPMKLKIVAQSASGKNAAVDAAKNFFPKAAYYELSASTARALVYTNASFRHRTVVMTEIDSIPEDGSAASAIRSIVSDSQMRYATVEKDINGRFTTRLVTKEGPTGLVTTGVQDPREQLDTRTLTITLSDSADTTRQVMLAHARRTNYTLPPVDYSLWVIAQRILAEKPAQVFVPYAEALMGLLSPAAVRMRRDSLQLLSAIRAVAILHREQRQGDDQGRIVAAPQDYRLARWALSPSFESTGSEGASRALRETVRAVEQIYDETEAPVTLAALGKQLQLAKSTVSWRVNQALAKGFLANNALPHRPFELVPASPLPSGAALPTGGELTKIFCAPHPEKGSNIRTGVSNQIGPAIRTVIRTHSDVRTENPTSVKKVILNLDGDTLEF